MSEVVISKPQAVFVNMTGGGVYLDDVGVGSGLAVQNVISPTGTVFTGTQWKRMWLSHKETCTINYKYTISDFHITRNLTSKISYTCEDDSTGSTNVPITASGTLQASLPSRIAILTTFNDERPRVHVLDRYDARTVNGYPSYHSRDGKRAFFHDRGVTRWKLQVDGVTEAWWRNTLPTNPNQTSAIESFPLDSSCGGNGGSPYGFYSFNRNKQSKAAPASNYIGWDSPHNNFRAAYFMNLDSVGAYSPPALSLNENTVPGAPVLEMRTDLDKNYNVLSIKTGHTNNQYNFLEFVVADGSGKTARFVTQWGNFTINLTRLGFTSHGGGNTSPHAYITYRRWQIGPEAGPGVAPSNKNSRISKWSAATPWPRITYDIIKTTPSGSNNGWAVGQLGFPSNTMFYHDCGYDTKWTIHTTTELPLVIPGQKVVMGASQAKQGVLSPGTYSFKLRRSHSGAKDVHTGSFKIISNSRTENAATYINNNAANYGGVGIKKATFESGWQCCDNGRLNTDCNLYSPADAIKDANPCGGIGSTCWAYARSGSTHEVFAIRYIWNRSGGNGTYGWFTTTIGGVGNTANVQPWIKTRIQTGRPKSVKVCPAGTTSHRRCFRGCWSGCIDANGRTSNKISVKQYPYVHNGGDEKNQLRVRYHNPTHQHLQIKIHMQTTTVTDDTFIYSVYIYNETTGRYDWTPPSTDVRGNTASATNYAYKHANAKSWRLPGAWSDGRATFLDCTGLNTSQWRHRSTKNSVLYAAIPPETKWRIDMAGLLGWGSNQWEGGAGVKIGIEPVKFVD
jgi:hypothetical protein